MSKITNYAIIDQVGLIENGKEAYNRIFKASSKKFEKTYTLKNVCKIYSPYCKEVTDKQKYFHRHNREPKMVYLLCQQYTSKAQFIQSIWEDRGIHVELVILNKLTSNLNEISKYRRCAMIWGEALGWTFSAPLIRVQKEIPIDMYTKRHIGENEINASYGAKRTTSPEKFISHFIEVAPEQECIDFFQHYRWLYENDLLEESLEPDWVLCPNCGRPVRNGSECNYCDTPTNQHFSINGYDFETDEFKHIKDFDLHRLIDFDDNYYNIEEPVTQYFDDSYKDTDE